ncbi:MAG: hypothetical protein HW389_3678, partial [Bacteroidetes bacterium]|nr:hypothetical protein [Bacteroidota bacterium]
GDTIAIKIHDDIGAEFFAKLRDGADEISTNDLFADYFPGIVLIADETNRGCITGFSGNPRDVRMVLLTTRSDPDPGELKTEFTMYDSSRQFNHIAYDRSATRLAALREQRTKLPSSSTGGMSFLQGGVGLMIRVDFPSLQQALLYNKSALVSAELSVAPLSTTYNVITPPSVLNLYEADALNRSVTGIAASTLAIDELYHEETAYTFNITQYLRNELSDSYVDPDKGLLITLPSGAVNSSFARFIADAGSRKMKLKLYYLSY